MKKTSKHCKWKTHQSAKIPYLSFLFPLPNLNFNARFNFQCQVLKSSFWLHSSTHKFSVACVLCCFAIIYPINIFHGLVLTVYDRACNIFKCNACIFFLWKGWCLDTVEMCCKGCWDRHAYSNPLLDMAALNRRRACSTQGWFVFHVFFFLSFSFFFQAPSAHTKQGPRRHLIPISCRPCTPLVRINIIAE